MLKDCLELLHSQEMLVLATDAHGAPHTSLMAYTASPDGREVVMATLPGTRKWANLAANPEVSLLVDNRAGGGPHGGLRALTVGGTFVPAAADEERALLARVAAAHPHLQAITGAQDARIIRIRVRSLLLLSGPTEAYHHDFPA